MYEINMENPNIDFIECFKAAGTHLNAQVDGGITSWFRAHPYPPFLEHLSFGLGNQLFFIRIESISDGLKVPGTMDGLLSIARECLGHACILPMKLDCNNSWITALNGWGLVSAINGLPINPQQFITNEKIEMTDWELHDFAVQIVRDKIIDEGYEILSFTGDPRIDPSIWFVGDDGPEWVVVKEARFPHFKPVLPKNIENIAKACRKMSFKGNFAAPVFSSIEQIFDSKKDKIIPLIRGMGTTICYDGLEKIVY